jgi:hypothetical protein
MPSRNSPYRDRTRSSSGIDMSVVNQPKGGILSVLCGDMPSQPKSPFTPQERDLIRLEIGMRFGQYPELTNGLFLRTWHSGPHKGEPKIPKAVQTMIDRGLVEIRRNPMGWQATFFTEAGLEALRQLLRDRRAMDPERFAHLRQELGL